MMRKKYTIGNGVKDMGHHDHDFNNGTVGWTDWNILLDENGGPNHVGNFCFAPVHADTKTGEITYITVIITSGIFPNSFVPVQKE